MGRIVNSLSADCERLNRRWTADFGAWNQQGEVSDVRNQGVAPPTGGISGHAVWVDTKEGISYQYPATVLAQFRESALHTHPGFARRPSLIDVSPAISKTLVSEVTPEGLVVVSEQITNWSASPINAIDALLMTETLGVGYESRSFEYLPLALVAMPTFAFHNDVDGYYLSDPLQRVVAPFAAGSPLGVSVGLIGEPVLAEARNATGETHILEPARDTDLCDRYRTALTPILLTNIVNFSHSCDVGAAELRIWARSSQADLSLQFSGQMTSGEGVPFVGLPVQGLLFQSVRGVVVDGGLRRSWGWARPMQKD